MRPRIRDLRERGARSIAERVVGVAVAAALLVDADTHLRDARFYDSVRTSVLSEGTLFRVEAGIALVLAIPVLLVPLPVLTARREARGHLR